MYLYNIHVLGENDLCKRFLHFSHNSQIKFLIYKVLRHLWIKNRFSLYTQYIYLHVFISLLNKTALRNTGIYPTLDIFQTSRLSEINIFWTCNRQMSPVEGAGTNIFGRGFLSLVNFFSTNILYRFLFLF